MVAIEFIITLGILVPQILRALQVVNRQRIYNQTLDMNYIAPRHGYLLFVLGKLVSLSLCTRLEGGLLLLKDALLGILF